MGGYIEDGGHSLEDFPEVFIVNIKIESPNIYNLTVLEFGS